jgi:hypothetical protein
MPSTPAVDVSMSKIDSHTSFPSSTPPKVALGTPKVQEVAKPRGQHRAWNTKNLGLRLASDFTAGFLAAGMVAPVITVIDKFVPLPPLSASNSYSRLTEQSCKMLLARIPSRTP